MQDNKVPYWLYALGLIPVIWFALLIAPYSSQGLGKIISKFSNIN